jgi:hypothetical protein
MFFLTVCQNVNRLVVHVEKAVEAAFDALQRSVACDKETIRKLLVLEMVK